MKIWKRAFSFALTFALFLLVIGSERCRRTPAGGGGEPPAPPEHVENLRIQTFDDTSKYPHPLSGLSSRANNSWCSVN